ncbi:MAG: FdhF/YdeP family oxidoreductase [Bacteroidota bacterium]
MTKRDVSVTGNTSFTGLQLQNPAKYAAGLKGVKVALEHAFKEMGVSRSFKALNQMNQEGGFDCPGCAWPDPEKKSRLGEYCENGAKALAEEATNSLLYQSFFEKYSVEEISRWTDFQIGKSGRISSPMILRPGKIHYEPISYDEAFKVIADHLYSLQTPDEAVFYTSGRSSNEAAFLYGLFVRAFGTNNMPDCSNMCHESSGVALKETVGIGKGSVTLEDFEDAEVVMVIGQNPGTNHPRMLSALEKCKQNGGKIISVNPLEEAGLIRFKNPQKVNGVVSGGTRLTDVFLQVKINQDIALIKLLIKRLVSLDQKGEQVFDHDFIKNQTQGYEAFIADLAHYSEHDLLVQCGVRKEAIDIAVEVLARSKRIIICWAMGLTQHKNGVENIKELVNLLLLKGSIGKKGAGTCPVRGHSNVQGDRTVGIMHHVSKPLNQSIKKVFGFDPPQKEGLDTVHAIEAMHERKAKVFFALGGNFLSAASDTHYTAEALQNCDLTVAVSTKLNRSHLITGKTAIILPTLGRSEQDVKDGKKRFVTVENSMGKVHRSSGILPPCNDNLMSEPAIIGAIAQEYFSKQSESIASQIPWDVMGNDYDLIREKIEAIITGFKDYSNRSKGGGFYLPNNARDANFSSLPQQRASFSICNTANHQISDDEFLMMTIRSHDQFNTTIYGMDDRYRGVFNERRVVFISEEDLERHNLRPQQIVDISSNYDQKERKAINFQLIPYNIPSGNLAAYFPETNVLVPYNHFADKSHTPISKSIVVKIHPKD